MTNDEGHTVEYASTVLGSATGGRVSGKIALVTGAAQGMGASHARLLADHGATVLVADIQDDLGDEVVRELVGQGLDASYVRLDISSEAGWASVAVEIEKRWGRLDVLVNNAAIGGAIGGPEHVTPEEWRQVFDVNQTGAYLGMRTALRFMSQQRSGSIINVSSVLGYVADPDGFAYGAAKAALRNMTRSVALEYAQRGIRVNAICPGIIRTPLLDDEPNPDEYLRQTPMARLGDPIEISYGVLFLASDESSFMTGADLVIDGGYLAK